jgi:secondary thiamine-phosphate synthase enzyme
MAIRLDAVHSSAPQIVATARLAVDTAGEGLTEITREVARFLAEAEAGDGVLLAYLRHTSASLTIQENADPDVRTDLTAALGSISSSTVPGRTRAKPFCNSLEAGREANSE